MGKLPLGGGAASFTGPSTVGPVANRTAIVNPLNYEVMKNGEIWAVSRGGNNVTLVLQRYLPDTGATDTANSHVFSNSAVGLDVFPYTLASLNNVLVFPKVSGLNTSDRALACFDPTSPTDRYKATELGSGVDVVYGPTATTGGELYVATAQGKILKVAVGDCTADPVLTEVADITGRSATTRFFEASDGKLYFGTSDATLMRFDPVSKSVETVRSFAAANGRSDIHGYLSETMGTKLVMVVRDVDTSGYPVARRLVSVDLAGDALIQKDVSSLLDHDDRYPGVTSVQ